MEATKNEIKVVVSFHFYRFIFIFNKVKKVHCDHTF